MTSFLQRLFGGSPAPRKKPPIKLKTYAAPTNRAEILKDAMAAHRSSRAQARDELERTLADLRAKIPMPSKDEAGMERLLSLQRANADLKRLMGHDLKRFLVLVGIRQLLEEGQSGGKGAAPPPKISKR